MAESPTERGRIVEQGDIYFAYRPQVEEHDPGSLDDVQRFYLVLGPSGQKLLRLIVIGRKRLPDIGEHERNWGFVEAILHKPADLERRLGEESYETKTRGERTLPAARPAGEGVYVMVRRGRELYLTYELELPREPGPVQKALNIAPQASFALSIRNPERPEGSPTGGDKRARYPKSLQAAFRDRKFATEEPRLLDYEDAELVIVGAREDPEAELEVEIETDHPSARRADVFRKLHLEHGQNPMAGLLEGRWA